MLATSQAQQAIVRETPIVVQRRALCVRLNPTTVTLWLKGKQTKFDLDYESMFHLACKKAWEAARGPRKLSGRRRTW